MDLDSVADELYGLPPGDFTKARDSRAADAKGSGDTQLATSIKQLKRPTTAAWLANLLARERGDGVEQLLQVGEAMRRAQSNLEAGDMRALADERRRLVAELGKNAKTIAGDLGQTATDSSIQELEATLEAAVADPAAAESLRSARLTKALSYSGFGSVDLTDAVAVPTGPKPKTSAAPHRSPKPKSTSSDPDEREALRLSAERDVREARSALVKAERRTAIEQERLAKAVEQRDRLAGQVEKMDEQIRVLRVKAKRAASAADQATRSVKEARRTVSEVEDHLKRASAALDRISATS